jgi:hypothetical protein
VTERHVTRHQVPAVLVRRELDAAVASECFEHFNFDQRHLTIDVVILRVGSKAGGVAVAF